MEAIYILAVFGEYMGEWQQKVENSSSWVRKNGRYQSEKLGLTLAMRFCKDLNVTIYECSATTDNKKRVSDLESFQLEQAWRLMWGNGNMVPQHITIYTKSDYKDLLLKANWTKERETAFTHKPTNTVYECDDTDNFHFLSMTLPGSVQICLKKLAAQGFPINQKFLTNVG